MMTLEKCPTSDELRSLSLGQLPEEQSDLMLGHVQSCGNCQAELQTDDAMEDTLVRSLREPSSNTDSTYAGEPECQIAMAKALGALAARDGISLDDSELSQLIPKVLGDYEIVRSIGRGGMGNVYLARHQKLGREVALKVLSSHRLLQPRMRQRFETEMRAVGQLSHPNVVTAFDAREVDDLAVLVTEYIDGLDVAQILRRTGNLPVAEACEITQRIAEALDYVNEQGLVHRDVKPSNVMVSRTGEVKLLDLGLARLSLNDDNSLEMTATGQAMGTADYVAPEQVNDSRNVDIRADFYALGCTLYKMLSGRPPFPNEQYPTTFAKMTAHVAEEPTPLQEIAPDVPAELAKLVHQMMAKSPDDRPQNPGDVVVQIEKFTHGASLDTLVVRSEQTARDDSNRSTAVLSPRPQEAKPPSRFRIPPIVTAIGAGALGLMLGVIITINNSDGTSNTIQAPPNSGIRIDSDGNTEIVLNGAAAVADSDVDPLSTLSRSEVLKQAESVWAQQDRFNQRVTKRMLRISGETLAKYEELIDKHNSGVVRLIDSGKCRYVGGSSYYSFSAKSHDGPRDLRFSGDRFSVGFAGGDTGAFERIYGGRSINNTSTTDISSEISESSAQELYAMERANQISDRADVRLNGLYALRSIRWDQSDLLVVFQVVESDDTGITIAWRLLKEFPPTPSSKRHEKTTANAGNQTNGKISEALALHQRATALAGADELSAEDIQSATTNKLRKITLGLMNYESVYRRFPAGANDGLGGAGHEKKTKPIFSWRVAILPFLECQDLYEKYDFDEEWNSEHNRKLLSEMPGQFRHPTASNDATGTRYQAVWGPRTIIGESSIKIAEIVDGTSNTIMLVEAATEVPWTKPDDIWPDAVIEMLQDISGDSNNLGPLNAAFADGAIRRLVDQTEGNLRALMTRDGGEQVDRGN